MLAQPAASSVDMPAAIHGVAFTRFCIGTPPRVVVAG
jgi:hypothetical protein